MTLKPLEPHVEQALRAAWASNMPTVQMVALLGMKESTCRTWATRLGLGTRSHVKRPAWNSPVAKPELPVRRHRSMASKSRAAERPLYDWEGQRERLVREATIRLGIACAALAQKIAARRMAESARG
jgi:hypothetical protein